MANTLKLVEPYQPGPNVENGKSPLRVAGRTGSGGPASI